MKNKHTGLLLLLLFIGFSLRIYDLGGESIWFDEGASIYFAKKNVSEIFSMKESSPPLYYIVLHWWINLFGDSEFSVRLPSVIFAFFSIAMMYVVGKQLFGSEAGLVSALLLALSRFHILYSQEARTYSLSALLTLLSMYFLIELMNDRSRKNLLGYVLSSCLLMYSHIYGLFIIIAQNIYFVTQTVLSREARAVNLKKWILIQMALLGLFAPWAKVFFGQVMGVVQSDPGGTAMVRPSTATIISTFSAYFLFSGRLSYLFFLVPFLSVLRLERISGKIEWTGFFRSLDALRWKVQLVDTGRFFFVAVWLLTPIIVPFLISRSLTPIYLNRYTIVAAVAFYLLVGKGICNIQQKFVKTIAIVLVVVFSLVSLPAYYSRAKKNQWREAAHYIDANARSEDLLVVNPGECLGLVFNYYSKRADLEKKGFPEMMPDFPNTWSSGVNEGNVAELKSVAGNYRRLWLILTPSGDRGKALVSEMLSESFGPPSYKKYYGVDVYLYAKEK